MDARLKTRKSRLGTMGEKSQGLICRKRAAGEDSVAIWRLQQSLGNRVFGKVLQANLRVGDVDDPLEREADLIADAVMRVPSKPELGRRGVERVYRQVTHTANRSLPRVAEQRIERALGAPGRPLPSAEREFFENRLGHDLSDVRISEGPEPAASAEAIQAKAYTVGQRTVFGRDQFQPGTQEGRQLIGHELVHVLQQRRGANALYRQAGPTEDRALQPIQEMGGESSEQIGRASMKEYLIAADEAVKYTRTIVRFGSIEPIDILLTLGGSVVEVSNARDYEDALVRALVATYGKSRVNCLVAIAARARAARLFGVGNCGENAATAFMWFYLNRPNLRPIDYCDLPAGDHGISVIGSPVRPALGNYEDWWTKAVVSDPYYLVASTARVAFLSEYNTTDFQSLCRVDTATAQGDELARTIMTMK